MNCEGPLTPGNAPVFAGVGRLWHRAIERIAFIIGALRKIYLIKVASSSGKHGRQRTEFNDLQES